MVRDLTCLLVDDDSDDQEIFFLAVKDIGVRINCVVAGDGIEALKKLEDVSFNPDLIFLDLNMPRMNGKECLSEIKKMRKGAHIPVVVYSTSSSTEDQQDVKNLGALSFITKPACIKALTQLLKDVFESIQPSQASFRIPIF